MATTEAAPVRCLIALGSNLGDRLANLVAGVDGLRATDGVEVIAVSPLYETAPVGGPENQGPYLNAALVADTTLTAPALLRRLHELEATRERQRIEHWGPRTLDLDLLVHGDLISEDPRVEVPHPRMHQRRFVMVPAVDIAPDMVHPRLGRTMRELLADLPVEPGDLTRAADHWHTNTEHRR